MARSRVALLTLASLAAWRMLSLGMLHLCPWPLARTVSGRMVKELLASTAGVWAARLEAERGLSPEWVRWYPKRVPTFSDALALVRRELWMSPTFAASAGHRD